MNIAGDNIHFYIHIIKIFYRFNEVENVKTNSKVWIEDQYHNNGLYICKNQFYGITFFNYLAKYIGNWWD